MACGCNGVPNGSNPSVLEVNSSTLTSCGAPQCTGPADTCSDSVPAGTPVPYYMQAPAIQQNNCQQFITQQFSTTVKSNSAWNVPVCGGIASATFSLPNVTTLLVGSNLWNESYGYFEVIAWVAATQMVTVANNCVEGNAAAGTFIPACTEFLVDGPICDCSGGGVNTGAFVAIDFTAPVSGTCLNITVTSIEGLVIGKNIQIGSGIYRISAIVSNEVITICNDGSGITPGTPVIAKNGSGDYQYPITLIDTNPCTNPAVTQGSILVCDGSGLTQPLDASAVGMVPVVVDVTTNAVQFKALDIPARDCTVLTTALTLVTGTAGYVLNVASSAGFLVGEKLQIGSATRRYTITGFPSGTQFSVTADPVPVAIEVIPIGTSVCEQPCCDTVLDEALCGPQKIVGAIPVGFFITGAIPAASFEQRVADGTAILRLPIPEGACPGQTYRLTAEVSIYALTDQYGAGAAADLGMHECELAWVVGAADPVAPRTEGKMIWTSCSGDTAIGAPPYPASTQAAIWSQLIGNAANNYSMSYHGSVIRTSRAVVAGETMDLALIYKYMCGDVNPPATVPQTQFMLSGIWELTRT